MPRGPRLDSPGTLHHVMIRGINKGEIFMDDDDRIDFIGRMGTVAEDTATSLHAFALMHNHVHMLLKSSSSGLPAFMCRLLTGYALYFNRRHRRVGHLFQNRYKSIVCEEDAYFRKLVAYIHLNPVRGGLVATIDDLEHFPWCGHADVLGLVRHRWFDRRYVLGFFGGTEPRALRSYAAFLEEEMSHDREDELDGGGFKRSQADGAKANQLGNPGTAGMSDERILGSGEFVRDVLEHAEDRMVGQLYKNERLELARKDIEALCHEAGVSLGHLRSGARYGALSKVRQQLVDKLVNGRGLSLAETSRLLGVSISAVYQIMQRISDLKSDGIWEAK